MAITLRKGLKMKSVEDMVYSAIAVYYYPNKYLPNGLPFAVAKKKAAESGRSLKSAIEAFTEADMEKWRKRHG